MTHPEQPRDRRQWARMLVPVYGPTLLASIGFGAIVPLIAVQAAALGASIGVAAAITALPGLGLLLFDLPAGTIAARLGEKRSIVLACLIDAVLLSAVYWANSLPVLAVVVFVHGMTGSVFALARQTYLTETVPLRFRARAMSTLGGVFRIGGFLGPLIASVILTRGEVPHAFVFAASTSLLAAVVTLWLPDLSSDRRQRVDAEGHTAHTWQVLRTHRRSLLTVGVGCLGLMVLRGSRQTIVPLWATHLGLDATLVSLLYALSMAFDVLLFFPGGVILDRFGRWWVAVPTPFVLAVCMLVLPLAQTGAAVAVVAVAMGIGNGIGSGIVLTLGADASPSFGRSQFLAGWRVLADTGSLVGPGIIAAVTAFAGIAASSVVVGALGILGTLWMARWVPRSPDDPVVPRPSA